MVYFLDLAFALFLHVVKDFGSFWIKDLVEEKGKKKLIDSTVQI